MFRWLALFALPLLLFGAVACGGDDDDSDDDDSGDDDSEDGRTDNSNATGTVSLDGKNYTLDLETCQIKGTSDLTLFAGKVEGDRDGDFSGSGLGDAATVGVSFGDTGYIAIIEKLKIDGKSVSYDGTAIDPIKPGTQVPFKFAFKC